MSLLLLENGFFGEGGPRPACRAWGNRCGSPGGSEARPPVGGRPGGLAAPALWGLPLPARRMGDPPGRGLIPHRPLTKAWPKRQRGLWGAAGGDARCQSGQAGRGGPAARHRPGGHLSPARWRIAPAGRGTEAMGFRPASKAAGRRERSDRRVGGSVGEWRPAPRARLSLKPIKPIYTYWVPFSALAKFRFRY